MDREMLGSRAREGEETRSKKDTLGTERKRGRWLRTGEEGGEEVVEEEEEEEEDWVVLTASGTWGTLTMKMAPSCPGLSRLLAGVGEGGENAGDVWEELFMKGTKGAMKEAKVGSSDPASPPNSSSSS
jgi:hypothetical protein